MIIRFTYYLMALLFTCGLAGCCLTADCAGSGGIVKVRLLKNGQSAISGPDALLDIDHISYYPIGFEYLTNPVWPNLDTQSISMLLDADDDYILVLDSFDVDTISVTSERVGKGECGCFEYRLTSVTYNGELVCTGTCEEVIVIEI